MLCSVKLQASNPNTINANYSIKKYTFLGNRDRSLLLRRRPYEPRSLQVRVRRRLVASLAAESDYDSSASVPSTSSQYTTSIGSSSLQLSQWNLTNRHLLMLNVAACAVAVSTAWLFFSAIPTLLAFKRAAESLEKLMDVTREELPDTMAAVRLSGMEISDLTMELSDLGQEITQGVKSSTRAVRLAEERLRLLTNLAPLKTNIAPSASLQEVVSQKIDAEGPMLATTARGIREGVVKGRTLLQMFFTLTRFSKMALNYLGSRAKK